MSDDHEPATKADLRAVEERVNQRFERVDERFDRVEEHLATLSSEMHHVFDDLKESMRDTQTELLKAFYGFAQSTDLKLANAEANDANLKERLSVVERRLTELERKINFPDQPLQ